MIIHSELEQGSDAWRQLRCGLPTGSAFSRIITGTGKPSDSMPEYAFDLALEKFKGKVSDDAFSGNVHTARGHELEPEARAAYEMDYACTVDQVAFVTNDLNTYGVSPDGFVGEDGLFEAKCLSDKEHIKLLRYYKKNNKAPSKYISQCQGQMFVCEREWCDLYFYSQDFRSVVIRQTPDLKFVQVLRDQLLYVIAERNLVFNELKELSV